MPTATLTRRAALAGALASSAALAVPAVASALPEAEHPNVKVRRLGREIMETLRDPAFIGVGRITITPEYVGYSELGIEDAILAHRRAVRAIDETTERLDALDDTPGYPSVPKVKIGFILRGKDDNGADVREPKYAYTHEAIEESATMWIRTAWTDAQRASYRRSHDAFHRELTTQIRRRAKFERAIGKPAALAANAAAWKAHEAAYADLLTYQPATAAEARRKAAYIKNAEAFTCSYVEPERAVELVMQRMGGLA